MAWGSTKKVRKYQPGARMLGIFDLISAFNQGRYVFVRGKAYHPTVLRNWSLASLEGACRGGDARVAELTPEWVAAEAARTEIAAENATKLDHEFAEVGE